MDKNDKKSKSIVWCHFKKEDDVSARWKHCTKILKHGGNTTNLLQHLKRKHVLNLHSTNPQCRNKRNSDKENNTEEEDIDDSDSTCSISCAASGNL